MGEGDLPYLPGMVVELKDIFGWKLTSIANMVGIKGRRRSTGMPQASSDLTSFNLMQ